MEPVMTADDASAIAVALERTGVRCWVMGGWGVDALLGRQTREHHDLDLLVLVDDLPTLEGWFGEQGFSHLYDWDETQPIDVDGARFSTAFVAGHADGRELDVHGVRLDDGRVVLATTDPWDLPADTAEGRGRIGTTDVTCVSHAAQHAMHRGYELPYHHLADLALLGRPVEP